MKHMLAFHQTTNNNKHWNKVRRWSRTKFTEKVTTDISYFGKMTANAAIAEIGDGPIVNNLHKYIF